MRCARPLFTSHSLPPSPPPQLFNRTPFHAVSVSARHILSVYASTTAATPTHLPASRAILEFVDTKRSASVDTIKVPYITLSRPYLAPI